MKMKIKIWLLAPLAVSALIVTGCGSGEKNSTPNTNSMDSMTPAENMTPTNPAAAAVNTNSIPPVTNAPAMTNE